MQIQWYPGHMTKARRAMEADRKIIDLVIEMCDARAPLATRNPDIDRLAAGKERIILLNKADLAEPSANESWFRYFESQGYSCILADSREKGAGKRLRTLMDKASEKKRERDRKRGIKNRPVRAMIAGIPNVGKSTLINSLVGKASAKTGNRPGVTRGNQWIKLGNVIELLDTPGILWPKFEDETVGEKNALLGSVSDLIVDPRELALCLLDYLLPDREEDFVKAYGTQGEGSKEPRKWLEEIAKSRGCLQKGGGLDLTKASHLLIQDFRSARLGRITLELPPVSIPKEEKESGNP